MKTNSYKLYDDDGVTFNYENGVYSWREITVSRKKDGTLTGKISKAEKGKPDTFGKVVWRYMSY